ncbi:YigZ family protein [Brevibacterium salitolerans]|uniref:YigZ family protein n=1 Tax=Brevibacterium salitolerans TaxID=1403566 RepID=A0ABN2WQS0_9MICO
MAETQEYRTLRGAAEAEIEIKHSRFLGLVAPVASEEEARTLIAQRRSAHPKARHHCTAFVLDPDARTRRFSDDGEPAGTAGAPILDVLTGRDLTYVLCVVTRYFGGTLLGAGGLVRAYGEAASAAADAARIDTFAERTPLTLTADYALAAALERAARSAGWSTEAEYGAEVALTLFVPPAELDSGLRTLADLSAGSAEATAGENVWARV